MRDTTQIPQPIAPAPELISTYPEMPKKLASIDPDFRRYHEENDRRYKRIREAFAEAQTHLALPVALVKLAQDRLDQAQVKLASELATANAKALAQAGTLLEVGTEIDAITGTLTSHATSINTLLSSIGGSGTDLSAITSRIDGMETTFAHADTDLQGNIDTWAQATTDLASEVHNATDGLPSAHSKIHTEELTRVADDLVLDGKIETGATKISALESSVNGVDGLIAKVTNIESTYATEAYAEAAASTAISTSLAGGGAIKTALDAAVVAGSGNKTYRQSNMPVSGMAAGDVWTDSDDNRLYRYSGQAWVNISDLRLAEIPSLQSSVSNLQSTSVTSAGATALANSAITASLGSGSEGTIGAAVTTLQTAMTMADGFLSGKYTLAVTAGGVVTGMNITSTSFAGDTTSEIAFQADKFRVTNGTTGVVPFEIIGGAVYIKNGMVQSLAANKITAGTLNAMNITGSTISGGTITGITITGTSSIAGASITGGTISGVTLSSATISSGTISATSGQIDSLTAGASGYAPTTDVFTCTKRATFLGDVVIGRPTRPNETSKLQICSLEACRSSTLTLGEELSGTGLLFPRVQILTGTVPVTNTEYAKLVVHGTTATDKTTINAGSVSAVTLSAETFNLFYANSYSTAGMTFNIGVATGHYNFNTSASHRMKFGEHTSQGTFLPSGYITILDSSGTPRKLAVIS